MPEVKFKHHISAAARGARTRGAAPHSLPIQTLGGPGPVQLAAAPIAPLKIDTTIGKNPNEQTLPGQLYPLTGENEPPTVVQDLPFAQGSFDTVLGEVK